MSDDELHAAVYELAEIVRALAREMLGSSDASDMRLFRLMDRAATLMDKLRDDDAQPPA